MWRIWFFFGILKISFAAPVETSQEDIIPSSELVVLKCLLSSPWNRCDDAKRTVEGIPRRIQKLYEKLKKPLLITNSHEIMDSALDTLPASFLYLIPKVRLSSMSGFTASDIVRRFPFDDALTMKIMSVFTDTNSIKVFFKGLTGMKDTRCGTETSEDESSRMVALISPAVEKEIAHAISRWFPKGSQWDFWLYRDSMITGSPMLASLPNYFLNSLTLETTEKFLFHIRNWRRDTQEFYDPSWSQHSMSVKRIWASLVLNKAEPPSKWTPKTLKQFGVFLIGATPDEISRLSTDLRISQDFQLLLDLNWNLLQARAIFDVGFSGRTDLTEDDLKMVKNVIVNLLPRQIQQFSYNVTNFNYLRINNGISIPTGKQLLSSYEAYALSKNKSKEVSPRFWKEHMSHAGKFFHLMPPSLLENLENDTLDLDALVEADSPFLSFRHSRYLTQSGTAIDLSKPETVLRFKGLLKSIPSSKLMELHSSVIPSSVKEHLLMFTSGESISFTASVLEKVKRELAETSYLEKMLYNKDFRQYFNLLGNRVITQKFKDITLNLLEVVKRNPVIERNIRLLPANTLSALLSLHRRKVLETDEGWNYENLIESPLKLYISGLTCSDIEILETSDFMPVIGYYVHQRRAMNEVFPKNMQYCSQKALTKYFKLKASLRGLNHEPHGLLNLMELHEVRAVGGYILAGLPINVIETLGIKLHVISEIGKLTIPELMTATSVENIKRFAEIYVNYSKSLNLETLTGLGNLVWFLNEDKIQNLNTKDFKLHMESMEENAVKALCLTERERNAWKKLLIRAFGKPDSWSSGTLSYLGDLLYVFDSYEHERINKTSRIEAADVLSKSTSFQTTLEWPGKTKSIHLYDACLEVLKISEIISFRASVKRLLRFYLESNQYLLETVSPAHKILKLHEEPNLIKDTYSIDLPSISTHLSARSEDFTIKPKPAKDIKNEEYLVDDYNSKAEITDYNYDEVKAYLQHDAPSEQINSNPNHSSEGADAVFKVKNNSPRFKPESYTTERTLSRNKFSLHPHSYRKDKSEISREHQNDNFLNDQESTVFESQSAKSYEEIKEELQKNASRALIVEVPLNQTNFLNFGTSSTEQLKVSCDAIKMLDKSASFILNKEDFQKMDNNELEDCAEYLGTLNLDYSVKTYIWSRLEKWRESGNLLEVGNLVSAIEENDITKIPLKLSEPWALENLHALSTHITDEDKMLFISDQFLLKNMKLPALKYEPAVSLGRLVCTMTLSHQRKYLLSHPEVFVNAVKTLGRSLECSNVLFETCIRQLADIATSQEAFGETHKWSANDVSDLGVIVAGLKKSDWELKEGKGLKAEAFSGLSPTAVSCIPPNIFKVLTESQLQKIPTLSAAVISTEQSSSLSPSQYEIIDRVRRQIPPLDLTTSYSSGISKAHSSFHITIGISITFYVTRTFFYI